MNEKLLGYKTQIIAGIITIGIILLVFYLFQNWQQTLREGQFNDYYNRAVKAQQEQDYTQAVHLYKQAVTVKPHDEDTLVSLGNVAFSTGNYQQSLNYYQQAGARERAEVYFYQALEALSKLHLQSAISRLGTAQQKATADSEVQPAHIDELKDTIQQPTTQPNESLRKAQIGHVLN